MAVVLQGVYEVLVCQILPLTMYKISIPKGKGLNYYALCAPQNIRLMETEDSSYLRLESMSLR